MLQLVDNSSKRVVYFFMPRKHGKIEVKERGWQT